MTGTYFGGDQSPVLGPVEVIMADQPDLPDDPGVVGSRAQSAYRETRRRIVELEMPPGATFTEGALATALGMSKTPVREALSVLAAEEFLEIMPQTGYAVRPVTLRSIHWTFDLHVLLAGRAAESLRTSPETTDRLGALLAARGPGDDPAQADAYLRSYMQFHLAIAAHAANRRLRTLLARQLYHHERLVRLCLARGALPGRLVGDDQPLLDELRVQNWPGAGVAARDRLQQCRDRVLEILASPDQILDVAIRN
jgi:DNA-binding GntR family transcriptional regulator